MAAPVTPLASSEQRNTMIAASSSGLTQVFGSAFGMFARLAGWSMVDGSTQFAVIPSPLSSSASASVHRMRAPYAMAYGAPFFRVRPAAAYALTVTMRP
jgi:hypothetical protein